MSVLESIRKRTGLLVGIVGLAIILFILQLSLGSDVGGSVFGGGNDENTVGVINGVKIDYPVFNDRVISTTKDLSRGQEPTEQQKSQAVGQAWEDLIREIVFEKEYEKLGLGFRSKKGELTVSSNELYDQMLANPHSMIVSQFRDPQTGQIDQRFANPDGSLNVAELNKLVANFTPDQEKMWRELEKYVVRQRLVEKYTALIKGGLYVTAAEAKVNYTMQNTYYDVRYVLKKYSDIPDADVKVDDKEIQEYYNNHLHEYQNEIPSRSIEYVVWDIMPSAADMDTMKSELSRIAAEWRNLEVNEDSAFSASENNGIPDVNSYTRDRMSPEIDSAFFTGPVKETFGPYREGNFMKVIKLRGTEMVSDSARVRHILIAKPNPRSPDIKRTPEQAKKMADSLKDILVKDRKRWDEFVEKFSDDPGKKKPEVNLKQNPEMLKNKDLFPTGDSMVWKGKGGDYGWVSEASPFVPEFKSFALTGKKGDVAVVQTDFGYHIMEVIETSKSQKKKYKVATVSREIKPTDATRQAFLQTASEFAGQNNTGEKFQKAVEAQKLNKRVNDDLKENDQFIPGFQDPNASPKQLIRDIYKAKAGDVIAPVVIGDRVVVAYVKKVKDKGPLPLEYVKDEVTAKVRDQKKAEKIIVELKQKAIGSKNIDEVAAKTGLVIEKMENLQFTSYAIPKFGKEDELIATATTLKKGEMSGPEKGTSGVWYVQVENIKDAQLPKDLKEQQKAFRANLGSRAQYEPTEALKKQANIEDHKARFDY